MCALLENDFINSVFPTPSSPVTRMQTSMFIVCRNVNCLMTRLQLSELWACPEMERYATIITPRPATDNDECGFNGNQQWQGWWLWLFYKCCCRSYKLSSKQKWNVPDGWIIFWDSLIISSSHNMIKEVKLEDSFWSSSLYFIKH